MINSREKIAKRNGSFHQASANHRNSPNKERYPIPFGRHQGCALNLIPKQYIDWFLENVTGHNDVKSQLKAELERRCPRPIDSVRKNRIRKKNQKKAAVPVVYSGPPDITIYTDGGCWPNDGTGKGGWGFVCVETGVEDCGGAEPTTNNRMEIEAVIAAIWHHREINGIGQSLRIVSDSQYVVNACTSWMKKWKARGWKKSGGLKNADLWQQMDEAMEGVDVRFEWVRGHNGNEYNELADSLAEKGAQVGSVAEVDTDLDREFAEMFR